MKPMPIFRLATMKRRSRDRWSGGGAALAIER